jgi:hypothetical protein
VSGRTQPKTKHLPEIHHPPHTLKSSLSGDTSARTPQAMKKASRAISSPDILHGSGMVSVNSRLGKGGMQTLDAQMFYTQTAPLSGLSNTATLRYGYRSPPREPSPPRNPKRTGRRVSARQLEIRNGRSVRSRTTSPNTNNND